MLTDKLQTAIGVAIRLLREHGETEAAQELLEAVAVDMNISQGREWLRPSGLPLEYEVGDE